MTKFLQCTVCNRRIKRQDVSSAMTVYNVKAVAGAPQQVELCGVCTVDVLSFITQMLGYEFLEELHVSHPSTDPLPPPRGKA